MINYQFNIKWSRKLGQMQARSQYFFLGGGGGALFGEEGVFLPEVFCCR